MAEFLDSFNTNLQAQITNLQNSSASEISIVQNINNAISDVKNIYESKYLDTVRKDESRRGKEMYKKAKKPFK